MHLQSAVWSGSASSRPVILSHSRVSYGLANLQLVLITGPLHPVCHALLLQRFLQEHGEVQLSALGIAISSMVTVAEILKNKQLAEESRVTTSLEWLSAESRRALSSVHASVPSIVQSK